MPGYLGSGLESSFYAQPDSSSSPARMNPSASTFHFNQGFDAQQTFSPHHEASLLRQDLAVRPQRLTELSDDRRFYKLERDIQQIDTAFEQKYQEDRHILGLFDQDLNYIKAAVQSDLSLLQGRIGKLEALSTQSSLPRSHDEKLRDCLENQALHKIATGEHVTPGMTMAEAYISQAESAEALATELRKYAGEAGTAEAIDRLEETQLLIEGATNHHQRSGDAATSSTFSERTMTAKTVNCAIRPDESVSTVQSHSGTSVCLPHEIPRFRSQVDEPIPSENADLQASKWRPTYIARLTPLPASVTHVIPSEANTKTFTFAFLTDLFGIGNREHISEYSPGLFWISKKGKCLLPRRAFWLLDESVEPFLPKQPGKHGAKLTAFFNPGGDDDGPGEEAYLNAPVFVARAAAEKTGFPDEKEEQRGDGIAEKEYVYFGQYSQTRYSDRLDYDRMQEVIPEHVKDYWSTILSQTSRPPWMTDALIAHFWPKPPYPGPLPPVSRAGASATSSAVTTMRAIRKVTPAAPNTKVQKAMREHIHSLAVFDAEDKTKAAFLTKEAIRKAFDEPDCASESGLRLYWEYLECVGWDAGFYNMLAKRKAQEESGEGGVAIKKGAFEAAKRGGKCQWPAYDFYDWIYEKER